MSFPSDLEIAQDAKILPIKEIAAKVNIPEDNLELYGKYKAKLPLSLIDENKIEKSKLILVTAITPTPAGEGKTTVSIGLTEGLNKIGKKTIAVLREPSLGPVFGIKGGAAGGGYSQVIPMEDINLHFTGDFSAIEKANNLLAAAIDNNIQNASRSLNIDPRTVVWKRVMDMNDRALRQIVIGLGGSANGIPREDGFNITPASEVMAILCLAENFSDLKKRLGNIYVGSTYDKKPIYARDLNVVGAMAILLKDAIKPNLVQTLEGNPAILHGGPFASIAQGTNSVLATKMGLSLADYTVTEAGFGADLGAEKFLNIKCVSAGLKPDAVVVVATIRALRHHGGAKKEEYGTPNLDFVKKGIGNLEKHLENVMKFGLKPVVAINHFDTDSEEEINFIKEKCKEKGIEAVVSYGFIQGGEGTKELAKVVAELAESNSCHFKPLYAYTETIPEKIEKIATEIYGASSVAYTSKAKTQLKKIESLGLSGLPVCMVKTPKSLSDTDSKIGRPENFEVTVREFEFAAGAGFVIPLLGTTMRMPGLPSIPAAEGMDIDDNGVITGLS
ncbi:formate--tetrahydrofolate ligase [Riemerella anatipestifer]|uniref:Formate--tetrahydrofolate ligase n=1 Tax=Riemerella anatipestifer TaxID=34085 RepID=A0A1S7DUZ5_RIEAN|nr:formate--tetrahydrofolate ligase [Riemerella anatipestifer]AQY22936.1 Formate--tetrahydrofolate ligase [Riemerella anatipestifer]MCO4303755.1 formate--tetrahydrofolate ligase [Riemerella anatipestifer]MCO7351883.1 formate--tetrahydrofolate ligase [Riemerella anatipestifer]MCQ4039196.1 formate--tetrahydrofolate ligase [Riemerella anatipestifer]MCT6760723.1 formate--tetrahydrofolate ligase [Riemerella anatipestifer]